MDNARSELAKIIQAVDKASHDELDVLARIEKNTSAPKPDTAKVQEVTGEHKTSSGNSVTAKADLNEAPIFDIDAPVVHVEPAPVNVNAPAISELRETHSESATERVIEKETTSKPKREKTPRDAVAREQSTNKDLASAIEGLYEDDDGRLRQANGAFASHKQKELYEQQRKEEEKADEKQATMFESIGKLVSGGIKKQVEDVDAVDAVGASVGNSAWQIAKEVKGFKDSASEYLEESGLNSIEGIKEKTAGAVSSVKEKRDSAKHMGKSLVKFFKSPAGFVSELRESKQQESKSEIFTENSSERHEKEQVTEQQVEIAESQAEQRAELHDEQIDKLSDIEDAIKATAGGGAGGGMMDMFDMAEDFYSRKKGRRGRGRKSRMRAKSADVDYYKVKESMRPKSASRMSKALDTVQTSGKGLLGLSGDAVKGGVMSKVLGGAGKVFKPLAVMMGIGAAGA
ncbi:hypothetical protein, partial [Vibrio sonorensis]|uniref:hypothetical protein n=1 Tax=Vibrio sonorensis TaxID=1004316 RepID=UPI00111450D2